MAQYEVKPYASGEPTTVKGDNMHTTETGALEIYASESCVAAFASGCWRSVVITFEGIIAVDGEKA